MRQQYILAVTEQGKSVFLFYMQQEDGTWISKMGEETMQDIEVLYPEIVKEILFERKD
jgi:hypothetical protein